MTLIQQQRLIGAILLVCLVGVIAWFLLDTVEQNQPVKVEQEPIAFDSVIEPISDEIEMVEPVEETLVDPQSLESENKQPSEDNADVAANQPEPETEVAPAPAPAPAPQPEPKPQSVQENQQELWVLQLASFSVKENADALAKKVKESGHDPLIETISTAGTLIYRVRLQPVADRNKLEQTAQSLNKKLGLSTQIQHYDP